MAVADDCPIVVGLKAHYRFTGDIVPMGNTYRALTGESPTSGVDMTPDPGTATWNYLMSVNLGTLTFADVNVYLDVDFDPADGGGQVGPFTADVSQTMIDNGVGATSFIQDSQNLGFAFWQLIGSPDTLPFDPFANGVYDIKIRVVSPAGVELNNVPIRVETFTEGCIDTTACNYDANATDDDGSCEFITCLGCTDPNAENYDSTALIDDGSCVVLGCTYADACNYDSTATNDDGTCEYTSCVIVGCTYDTACNYDSSATEDDGSCEYYSCVVSGCTYADATNYNSNATVDDMSCVFDCVNDCPYDFTEDGYVNTQDLLQFLGAFGTTCE